ncbi:NAD(P)/FAD-dependent oxidoreductase [Aciduricibacillus chroicocephali]|uniref:NAD(P)/FAD-dependent oxidoreductase n=1 Tax=Aciduricibacillus chroicocephali TaxID=3054939 RepID=A0ABY9KWP4_9BACI|nr:NAD(P)/FAD-dependent oxidoreductase [Bacillaceae bacterium 44XB]
MREHYETIIIGAGQAGLAMGYYLKKRNQHFLILDNSQSIGDSWRNRYDSLILFTSRANSCLPGMKVPGAPDGYPTKDEIATYLKEYAQHYEIPVKLNTKVENLSKSEGIFTIATNTEEAYTANNVVIATGPFQQPAIPSFSNNLSDGVFQIHSAYYRNPEQLNSGPTVIIGGGNSGMQIAAELSATREVYLSISKRPIFIPDSLFKKDIFWWFKSIGILNVSVNSRLGKFLRERDPIIGLETQKLIRSGNITLLPRTISAKADKLLFENNEGIETANIIWATGYRSDYNWIKLPHIFDNKGQPIHKRGVTEEKGLYFLGLPWQHRRGSALLLGVGDDAAYLAKEID